MDHHYHTRLSKYLSYVLRHQPGEAGLTLDANGFADVEPVMAALRKRFKYFKREDLMDLVKNDPKKRFDLTEGRIRATYGHSVEVVPASVCVMPPEVLYHGTSSESAERILSEGLKPRDRQYVHLSVTLDDALAVGRRHTDAPVILRIESQRAAEDDIEFYKEGKLYMARFIPSEYIRRKNG
jgi:putative RNA 2'-phosphotransferase